MYPKDLFAKKINVKESHGDAAMMEERPGCSRNISCHLQ